MDKRWTINRLCARTQTPDGGKFHLGHQLKRHHHTWAGAGVTSGGRFLEIPNACQAKASVFVALACGRFQRTRRDLRRPQLFSAGGRTGGEQSSSPDAFGVCLAFSLLIIARSRGIRLEPIRNSMCGSAWPRLTSSLPQLPSDLPSAQSTNSGNGIFSCTRL